MRAFVLAPAALALTALSAPAQSPYTAEEVVQFMIDTADMGLSRGICIGTAQECAAPETPPGLDMLITFELDSADLTYEARRNLSVFAQALNDERLRAARFVVEGHTDAFGTEDYNADLSEARAAAVRNYLVALGVPATRLIAMGLGETKPRTEDVHDPENRRVELRIDLR